MTALVALLEMPVRPPIEKVVEACAYAFCIPEAEIVGKAKYPYLVRPRFAAIFLARRMHHSLKAIGEHFERENCTLIHADRRACQWIGEDPDYRRRVQLAGSWVGIDVF